jgi:hypothetical protein
MGQLTISPQLESFTDSILTISGTNIPSVEIYLAGVRLTAIEGTSDRVRVRLPAAPVTGALVIRRLSDGEEGVLQPTYVVNAAPLNLNWAAITGEAIDAAVLDIGGWLQGARIAAGTCVVTGAIALAGPGVIESVNDFAGNIRSSLLARGAPPAMAEGWDRGFRLAWEEWAAGTTIPGLPWYAVFAAYPGPSAPPMPNPPTPVGALVSAGLAGMMAQPLKARILVEIGDQKYPPALESAVEIFATVIGTRFVAWLTKAMVTNVAGSGPVPSFNPEAGVVAGPVQGSCSGVDILQSTGF